MKEPFVQDWTVGELAENFRKKILSVNPEYQRGAVWDDTQCRMFLDSVLREHYMPLIYLRQLPGEDRYEIIDGQQRINALYGFVYDKSVIESKKKSVAANVDGFATNRKPIPPLFVPADNPFLFPKFLRETPCLWGGKKFEKFPEELRGKFLRRELSVVIIDGSDEETRDMFIRLQGGSALTEQEIRDAWPGDFCDSVLTIGGKESQARAGHKFFNHRPVFRRPSPDRGQVRQLVAQAFMLFLFRRQHGNENAFCAIQARQLDDCYREHATMEAEDRENQERFVQILDELHFCFQNVALSRKMKNDDVIHLVLLLDSLLDDSSPWRAGIVNAFQQWEHRVNEVRKKIQTGASVISDLSALRFNAAKGPSEVKIRTRHEIFEKQMRDLLRENISSGV